MPTLQRLEEHALLKVSKTADLKKYIVNAFDFQSPHTDTKVQCLRKKSKPVHT